MTERDIFIAVLQIDDTAQRQAYLDEICAGQPELRRQVEDLLHLYQNAGSFLQRPAAETLATGTHRNAPEPIVSHEASGARIGPYKLVEQVGEGGMGAVWMAQQLEPVKRLVALKLIKAGMDSRQVIARFEAERQALALMDHPNIAKVLDAGSTESGRPYFVMDLVKGVPITKYCDEHHLTPRQRLELFIPVCAAVQHAHQKGIIHRDIKPSNVLVALHDGKPVPKVIDFGVAKAAGQSLTDKTLVTGFGNLVGTLEYMSPEQAQFNQLDIDTRSDIYSLGVLLYELLTGGPPFTSKDLAKAGMLEMLRVIREQEPTTPSAKLSTAEGLPTLAANRGTEPAKLTKLVRGELDWIVMKALEKDRGRRFETANGFAQDVKRYLANEPVQACPPSLRYRLRKFAWRNRGPVLAAALVVVALVGGIVGTTWGMIRATAAEGRAVSEAVQKETALREREATLAQSQDRLFTTLVQQASAARAGGRVGQRYVALAAVRAAAAMKVTPELRTEAAAALVLPDAEVLHEWAGWPEGSVGLAFDADFRRYARHDRHGEITVCRFRDGREEVLHRLPVGMKGRNGSMLMSPDGRHMAYDEEVNGPSAARAWVWKIDGPAPERLFEVSGGLTRAYSFHPAGRLLAVGHSDGTVSVYDVTTARRISRRAVGGRPTHLDFHPRDGRLAVVASGAVKVIDTDSGREGATLAHGAEHAHSAAWHPDGRVLATGSDFKVRLWDTETATEVAQSLEAVGAETRFVVFNRAGDRLKSFAWNLTTLWDVPTGRRLFTMPIVHGGFGPADRLIGCDLKGGNIRLWGMTDGRELRILRDRKDGSPARLGFPVTDAAGRIVAATNGLRLNFHDLESGKELASVRLPRRYAFLPIFAVPGPPGIGADRTGGGAGGWVTGGAIGVHEWPARPDPARPGVLRVGPPRRLAPDLSGADYSSGTGFSPDGRLLAVPQGNETLLLDRDRPDWRLRLGPQYDVRTAAVSPDGRLVVTCSWWPDNRAKSVRVWDASTGKPVHEMQEGPSWAQFSPDGRWLTTGKTGMTRLWDVETWREVRRYDGGMVAFAPDKRLMAVNDVRDGVRLFDPATGRAVAHLIGPDAGSYEPRCFTPDGTKLIAHGPAGVYVWDLRLIRRQLKELGLDWDWPEFPPPEAGGLVDSARAVEVDLGELGRPNREQRARDDIARYRRALAAKPDDPSACNNLAWLLATAPEPLRDIEAAVPLAEKAARSRPDNAICVNTLAVAYYRAGRYREAADLLRENLSRQNDKHLAFDLYFLAMSHHRLGDAGRGRDDFDWARRWERTQSGLSADEIEELKEFRAEAEVLFDAVEAAPAPRENH